MEEYILEKHDEVLLLDKGFEVEVFGTYWRTDKEGNSWCVDLSTPGNYMLFQQMLPDYHLSGGRTMTRERFEELFRG